MLKSECGRIMQHAKHTLKHKASERDGMFLYLGYHYLYPYWRLQFTHVLNAQA